MFFKCFLYFIESGLTLLDNVLELVDQGYYSTEAVQCLITALTDYAQTGVQEAWHKVTSILSKNQKTFSNIVFLCR